MRKALTFSLLLIFSISPAYAGEIGIVFCRGGEGKKNGTIEETVDITVRDGLTLPNEKITIVKTKNSAQMNSVIRAEAMARINKDTPDTIENEQDIVLSGCFQ